MHPGNVSDHRVSGPVHRFLVTKNHFAVARDQDNVPWHWGNVANPRCRVAKNQCAETFPRGLVARNQLTVAKNLRTATKFRVAVAF